MNIPRSCLPLVVLLLAELAGCSKAKPAPPTPAASAAAPKPAPAASVGKTKDAATTALLEKGTACQVKDDRLPLDCPEYKSLGQYALAHQGDDAVGETCAAFLRNADVKKQLLAARCIEQLNARTQTHLLGSVLDAIEAEHDPVMREQFAWAIKTAEAVTAKLGDRVLDLVEKMDKDPKQERAASYLFATFFPQYMMGSGPKPPARAQAMAIDALGRDGSPMQSTALQAVTMLQDTTAVCAALVAAMGPGKRDWNEAASAFSDLHERCAESTPEVIDLVVAHFKAGDVEPAVLQKLDNNLVLDAQSRAKLVGAARAARKKAPAWQRRRLDEAIKQLMKPHKKPRKN